jgi:hypothetical protein
LGDAVDHGSLVHVCRPQDLRDSSTVEVTARTSDEKHARRASSSSTTTTTTTPGQELVRPDEDLTVLVAEATDDWQNSGMNGTTLSSDAAHRMHSSSHLQ